MAVTTVTSGLNQEKGITYSVITDSSADWASVSNDTYFYDLGDGLPHYKDGSGTVLEVFAAGGVSTSLYSADDTIGSGRVATLTDTLTFNGGSGAIFKLYSTLRTDDIFQVFFNGGGEWLAKNGSIDIGAGTTYSNYFTRFYERGIKFYGSGVVVHEINNTTGNVYFMNDYMAGGTFTVGSNSPIGSEKISFQNRTAVKGADTLSTSTAFEIYDGDTTPAKLWDFRNNGDLIISDGLYGAFDGRQIKANDDNKIVFNPNGMEIYMSNPAIYCPNNTDKFLFKRADVNSTVFTITGAGWIGLNGKINPSSALDMHGGSISMNGSGSIYMGYGGTIGDSINFLEMNNSVGWGLYSTSKPFIVLNSDLTAGATSGDFFSIKTGGTSQSSAVEVFKVVDNGDIYTNGTLTLSSGRLQNTIVNPTVQETTSAATFTINATNENTGVLTAQAVALTVANPTGTIVQGQKLVYRIKDNGTARAITWGANFRAIGVTLPTTTTANKLLYVGCIYNTTDSKWDVVAVNEEA